MRNHFYRLQLAEYRTRSDDCQLFRGHHQFGGTSSRLHGYQNWNAIHVNQ